MSVVGLNLMLDRDQCIQYLADILHQSIGLEMRCDVFYGAADVRVYKLKDLGSCRGETSDAEFFVEEDSGDASTVQKVPHIIIDGGQIFILFLIFGIDGH